MSLIVAPGSNQEVIMAVGAVAGGADVKVTGRRVVAIIIDSILLGIVYFVMSLLFGTTTAQGGGVSTSLSGLPFIIYLLIVVAYYTGLEGSTGQTLGKMVLGIQVIRDGTGESPGMGKALIRTLLRIVDAFPVAYLVGFIVILVSAKNQRVGDMAAGTLVVRKGSAGTSSRVV
jgi:uncharacterized RDD family membrane protein YckC